MIKVGPIAKTANYLGAASLGLGTFHVETFRCKINFILPAFPVERSAG
jgi:hypothetical protein